jgi:hypothetical protein
MRDKKNVLNKIAKSPKATLEDKVKASETIRMYNYLLNINKEKEKTILANKQNKEYKRNFWKTAKDVTNGKFGESNTEPTFNCNTANAFYKNRYEKETLIDPESLSWFPKVEKPTVPYDLSPYTPKHVRDVLKHKDSNSAPGVDEVVYEYLQNMPYIHHVLATAFTKIRDTGEPPEDWGVSKIVLIKKNEDTPDEDPENFRMISLTINIGKLYHTLEAQRTLEFMVNNKYLDPVAQKAYIEGVNGCVEHITVVQEIIQHAKHNKKTVHMTWFDLEDAFGSVSHMLIPIVMTYYHLPSQITNYITNFYTNLKGKVHTNKWESDTFKFCKGVFQGDPFSGAIFLIVFNPLLEYIKQQKKNQGYAITTKTSAQFVTTTPFADDFNIISRNSTKHQQLVSDVEIKLESMGLVVKTPKCRSLSIQCGRTVDIQFKLHTKNSGEPVNIVSVLVKPMKFLGSELTGDNTPHAMFDLIHSKLKLKLDNIDTCMLRGEYKANIYTRYALPSIRYYLTVHTIHKTHMEKLDSLTRKYLKKWFKIPTHGVSDASIFHPYMLGLKAPSQLYKEAHAGSYTMIRMKGDDLVNHALDSQLERESEWTNKSSTICAVNTMYEDNIASNKTIPPSTKNNSSAINKAKKSMNCSIKEETLKHWNKVVEKLTLQGDFAKLLIEEQANITWKSVSNNIPKGVLSFALKSLVNGLNTPDNLKRWGVRKSNKCEICGNFGNLEHILNWCSVALKQGRLTWRHDSVLNYMAGQLKKHKPDDVTIYVDLPGQSLNGGTIPPDILVTAQRPDIVIINRISKTITLLELTVSFERNIEAAHLRKSMKYLDLTHDLNSAGWRANCQPFEIGSRGHITKKNKTIISEAATKHKIKIQKSKIYTELSKISLLCSFAIFQAHCQPAWQDPPYLNP